MQQANTLMLSRTKCSFMGDIYEFDEVTDDEALVYALKIARALDKKTFIGTILQKLRINL